MTKLRFFLAFAAVASLAWWWAVTPGTDAGAPVPQAQGAPAGPGQMTPDNLELQQRSLSASSRDLFATPPKPPPARAPSPVPKLPEAPQAPPLPYKYDGSGVVQGKSFVFLARNGRSVMASAGDTLDGTYVVEAVGRDRVALRYLPLGIRQVLLYAGGEAPPEIASAPDNGRPVALHVDVPDEVVVGQEFVVTLALPGAGALKATVEVGYDADVLSVMGANVRRPGRAVVEVASGSPPSAQLRFKVLADSPVSTDIDLRVSATDERGRRVPVSSPPAHTVSLVLPGA
jgi:hypothetical protein